MNHESEFLNLFQRIETRLTMISTSLQIISAASDDEKRQRESDRADSRRESEKWKIEAAKNVKTDKPQALVREIVEAL